MLVFKQALLLCFAGIFLAVINFCINPKRVAWGPVQLAEGEMNLESILEIAAEEEVIWVDARSKADFDVGHIPGAVLLNEDDWDALFVGLLDAWNGGSKIIVYCSGGGCQASHWVAVRLRDELGFDDVWVLHHGWDAWKEAKR